MSGELPADVLKELRFATRHSSRREFAESVGKGWSEDIARNLESFGPEGLPRTLVTLEHLYALRAARIIAEGDKWDVRLRKAMQNQARLVARKKGRTSSPGPSTASGSETQGADAQPGQTTASLEGAGGDALAPRPRARKWLPLLAALAVVGAAGSCFAGTRLARLLEPRPTPVPPKVVYQVVTATPNPAAEEQDDASSSPVVEYRVVTATPGPILPTATPNVIVVTATPQPVTATPRPTDTPTPTVQPTSIPLPFEDDFTDTIRPEWQILSGDWRVIDGRLTTVGQGDAPSVILVGDMSWTDYAFVVDVILNYFHSDFKILIRYQDEANMVALIAKWGTSVQICRNGKWIKIGEDLPDIGSTRTVRIEARNELYKIYYNNELVRTFSERAFLNGKVGLVRDNAEPLYFDNVKVIPLQ